MVDAGRPIELYEWIRPEFDVSARWSRVMQLAPYLVPLCAPGRRVLDLCCGTGPFSFWFEQQGLTVTGIDISGEMIDCAQDEKVQRGSSAEFLLGDALTLDYGIAEFDLIVLLGNSISDFPQESVRLLSRKLRDAVDSEGSFAIQYHDPLAGFLDGSYQRAGVQYKGPPRITRQFGRYLPDSGAFVETYTNESTGATIEYTSYIHTPATVPLAVADMFKRSRLDRIRDGSYLDVFSPIR